jgi:hypothetical protein
MQTELLKSDLLLCIENVLFPNVIANYRLCFSLNLYHSHPVFSLVEIFIEILLKSFSSCQAIQCFLLLKFLLKFY